MALFKHRGKWNLSLCRFRGMNEEQSWIHLSPGKRVKGGSFTSMLGVSGAAERGAASVQITRVQVTGLRAVPVPNSYPRTLLSRTPLWHRRASSLECRSGRTPRGPTRGDCSRDPLRLSGPPRFWTRAGSPCLEP